MKKKSSAKKVLIFLFIIFLVFILLALLVSCDEEEDYSTSASGGGEQAAPPAPVKASNSSFTVHDSRVKMIEINQSLSWGFDTDTGGLFPMDHFVAGKETALFVSFNDPLDVVFGGNMPLCYITVYRDGEVLTQLTMSDYSDRSALYFQPKNMGDVNNWEAGAYTFELYLGDNEEALAAVRTTTFFNSTTMKILAVPVKANYGGYTGRCNGDWQNAAQMIYATYPIAKSDIEYVLSSELDISGRNIETEDGQYELWKSLRQLQTPNKDYTIIVGFIPYPISVSDGEILGYTYDLPAVIVSEKNTEMMCTLIHEVAHCYGVGDEYEDGSINLAVNTPPYGMRGYDMYSGKRVTGNKQQVRSGFDMGVNGTGSMIYQEQRPFYTEGRSHLYSVSSYMGGGTDADSFEKWVSSEIWIHLFNAFVNMGGGGDVSNLGISTGGDSEPDWYDGDGDEGYQGGGNDFGWQCRMCCNFISGSIAPDFYAECDWCGCFTWVSDTDSSFECWSCDERGRINENNFYIDCPICEELNLYICVLSYGGGHRQISQVSSQAAAPEVVTAIEITGYIDADGVFVPSPWYTYETAATDVSNRKSGEYAVYFYNNNGKQISVSYFDVNANVQINTSGGTVFTPRDKAPVSLVARFPGDTAKIVMRKGDTEIYSTDVSKTAPKVSFTGLNDYDQLGNSVTLTWEASGEKDELYFEIWYCPNEDEYYNVASNVTGRSFTLDLSVCPGTEEGYFYIFATDGVRTGGIDSPWVKVPFKAPEIISVQDSVPEVKITEEICFDADIYDMQDGWLWDDEVSWTLDGREFMTGSFLWVWPYELPPGTHTFTCTATNSAGMSVQKDFSFTILDDESDIPSDWSRDDIILALSNGFVVPLNRIDMPITRGQYASLMTTLYGIVSELDDPYPDYKEGIVKDCGQDDYDQFLMVHLGVMEAPGGRFEPNKTLTENEAALIMYKVAALADPDYFDAGLSDKGIMEFLADYSVFDERGPGALQASEKLTNRLALVRLGRLYAAIFE